MALRIPLFSLAVVLHVLVAQVGLALAAQVSSPPMPPPAADRVEIARALPVVSTPCKAYSPSSGRGIDTVVIHYTSAINVDPTRWDDPALNRAIFNRYRVSAHYMIDRAGTAYRLVREQDIAWHAGGSIMPAPDSRTGVNRFSLGIELIATKRSGFTDAQYRALNRLLDDITARHPIRHVVGHDEIAGNRAVGRGLRGDVKPDPGPLFDWNRVSLPAGSR
jgi:N-acetyl-anhydromuramyl-L-alanine amidase AmpD